MHSNTRLPVVWQHARTADRLTRYNHIYKALLGCARGGSRFVPLQAAAPYRWQRRARRLVDIAQLARQAEAAQLDAAVLVQQHVAGLEVAVHNGVVVQVLQRNDQVAAKVVDAAFRQPHVLAQQADEVAAHAVLQDEPQVVGGLVPSGQVVRALVGMVSLTNLGGNGACWGLNGDT